jgi:DNA-binding response OmpR family regulator
VKARLLLVEDDADLARGLSFNLERESYGVELAKDAKSAALAIAVRRFDLVVLDLTLPDGDGLELLTRWRKASAAPPVICLTARSQETDVVAGLKLGADDYVTKPFGLAELFARIEAVLRRARPAEPKTAAKEEVVELGPVRVDLASHRVTRTLAASDGSSKGSATPSGSVDEPIDELTPIEADLLRYLLARRGRVLDRAQILKDLWGVEGRHATRTLDNHVARLRKKIEADPAHPRFLVTAHGLGYRLD